MRQGTPIRQTTSSQSPLQRDILHIAAAALAYFLAHQIAFLFPDAEKVLAAIWPAGGIGLAALLLSPRRLWPGIAIALFIAGNLANLLAGRPLVASVGFMTANVIESLMCAWLISRICGNNVGFQRVKEVVALIIAAVLVNAGTSFIGAGTATLTSSAPFWDFWATWWIVDGLGILLVTPLIVTWAQWREWLLTIRWERIGELGVFLIIWCVMAWPAFSANDYIPLFHPQPYLLTILLAWPALRYGQRIVTLALVVLAGIAITGTAVSVGPSILGGSSQTERLLFIQIFLGIIAAAGFLLASSYTEAKTAEQSAHEGQARLRTLGDNLPNGVIYQVVREPDGKMNFLYMSAGIERLSGISAEEAIHNSSAIYNLIIEEDRAMVAAAEATSAREMIDFHAVARIRLYDGAIHWIQVASSPQRLADGRILWDGILIDITERKQAEEILQARLRLSDYASTHSLGELLQNALDELCALTGSPIGFFHFVEPDECTLSLQAWSTRTLEEMCTAEGRGRHYNIDEAGVWVDCVRERRPVIHNDYASLLHRKGLPSGHAPVTREMIFPIIRDQKIVAIIGVGNKPGDYTEVDTAYAMRLADLVWDITERKRAEEALHENETIFEAFLEHSPVYVFFKDKEIRSLRLSKNYEQMLDRPISELLGKTMNDLFPSDLAKSMVADDLQILNQGQRINVVEEHNGHVYETTKFPIFKDGKPEMLAGFTIDITERVRTEEAKRQAEEALRMLNEQLEQRVRERTAELEIVIKELEAFSYSISHDLRSPLRAIDGFSRIIQEDYAGLLPQEGHELLDKVRYGAERMSKLIDDLLTFSRLSRQPLHTQQIQPDEIVRQVLETMRREWQDRQVEVTVKDLPACLGDLALVTQVWVNLLSNAFKYTRRCEIAQVEVGSRPGENDQTVYYVRDNGIGFDMRYSGKLFGVFQRLHRGDEFEGTGVGLALVQRIIARHGGRIWAEAEPDQGSTFYFTLPGVERDT